MNPVRSELDILCDHVEKARERYQAALAGFQHAISCRDGPTRISGIKQSAKSQTAAREELVLAIKAYTAATQVGARPESAAALKGSVTYEYSSTR
jgi:hypothetical protein